MEEVKKRCFASSCVVSVSWDFKLRSGRLHIDVLYEGDTYADRYTHNFNRWIGIYLCHLINPTVKIMLKMVHRKRRHFVNALFYAS